MDQDTLIAADRGGEQLVKYTIDSVTRTCTGQVVESGYSVRSVSCTQGGLVFATEGEWGVVMVRIYNLNTGFREEWYTNINSETTEVIVSHSAEFVVLSVDIKRYVYNKDRTLLYSVTNNQLIPWFLQTYVTETGVFWGTVHGGYKLLIMDLYTNATKISTEGIVRAEGVSGTRNGYVYVTDQNKADVGVYSANGTFLHRLHIDRPVVREGFVFSGSISLSNTEDLIALSIYNETTPIAVYRTSAP